MVQHGRRQLPEGLGLDAMSLQEGPVLRQQAHRPLLGEVERAEHRPGGDDLTGLARAVGGEHAVGDLQARRAQRGDAQLDPDRSRLVGDRAAELHLVGDDDDAAVQQRRRRPLPEERDARLLQVVDDDGVVHVPLRVEVRPAQGAVEGEQTQSSVG